MTTQTWIITGASRGFGCALAESALAAGDHVVAVRRPESVADLQAEYPDTCLVAAFDARDIAAAAELVQDRPRRPVRGPGRGGRTVRDPGDDRRAQSVPDRLPRGRRAGIHRGIRDLP
ncbi:SDR family NAD(P)-dependent oxidoreductase [Nonomuraea polychroma]|uniref:SDR family NAD(P)-dependent oxidoreductase n=1 Tax=Nonomuraea polychroma TaxID=46176 RepID=UPI003D92EC30